MGRPFEAAKGILRHRTAADAMKPVAAGDEVAVDAVRNPVLTVGDMGRIPFEIAGGDTFRLVDRGGAGPFPLIHQVAGEFRLTVDHHPSAAREPEEVDSMIAPVEGKREAVMRNAFGMHAGA